jgi:formylglycine-generating enzyme required for sulfatase activity
LLVTAVVALGVSTLLIGQAQQKTATALHKEEQARRERAQAQVEELLKASPQAVPEILRNLQSVPEDVLPQLRQVWNEQSRPENRAAQLRAGLALVPFDATLKDRLNEWMLQVADPHELLLVRDTLQPYGAELRAELWRRLEDPQAERELRFRAACALAAYDPDDPRWAKRGSDVVARLVVESPLILAQWVEAFRPVRAQLVGPLAEVFHDARRPEAERRLATTLLADYAADRPDVLAELVKDAADWQFLELYPRLQVQCERAVGPLLAEMAPTVNRARPGGLLETAVSVAAPLLSDHPHLDTAAREAQARRQARAAVALLRLGQVEAVWPLFRHRPEPEARSQLLARLAPLGADPGLLVRRLEAEPEVSARRALILALGEFGPDQLPAAVRQPLTALLLRWYRDDPDPGIHGAIDWLLRHDQEGPSSRPLDWGQADTLARIDADLAFGGHRSHPRRRWYVATDGQTLTMVPQPEPFLMGSPGREAHRFSNETLHLCRIGRSFAIATKPVSVRQFQEFRAQSQAALGYTKEYSPELDGPIITVTWYDAAAYCRWLSEREGVPEDQMCYPPVAEIEKCKKDRSALQLPGNYLTRTGYRLPTEAEWEYACRAGATSSRYFGSSEALLVRYAWYLGNAGDRTWPVGQKRPNDLGLFDMHGNVFQWCQVAAKFYEPGPPGQPAEDKEDSREIKVSASLVLRGGSFHSLASNIRSASRYPQPPTFRSNTAGMRVARTCDESLFEAKTPQEP